MLCLTCWFMRKIILPKWKWGGETPQSMCPFAPKSSLVVAVEKQSLTGSCKHLFAFYLGGVCSLYIFSSGFVIFLWIFMNSSIKFLIDWWRDIHFLIKLLFTYGIFFEKEKYIKIHWKQKNIMRLEMEKL